jgi:hypothetical protein
VIRRTVKVPQVKLIVILEFNSYVVDISNEYLHERVYLPSLHFFCSMFLSEQHHNHQQWQVDQ